MGGKSLVSKSTKNKNIQEQEGGKHQLKLGDVVWVKVDGSWWPAQVSDEDVLGKETKPKGKKLVGQVLVRLYGDYDFLYWDPEKHKAEFIKVLKKYNGSYRAILEKSVEQELFLMKSGSLKRKRSEPREKSTDEAPKDRKLKQNGVNKNQKGNIAKPPNVISRVAQTGKAKGSRGKLEDRNPTLTRVNRGDPSARRTREEASDIDPTKQNGAKTTEKADNDGSATHPLQKSPDNLSLRRHKVMQSLGLVAPADSPFRKNGVV